jgi:hypothetical protein
MRQEEREDYYEKWLKEDIVYIISEEEKGAFENLNTPEEKENSSSSSGFDAIRIRERR